MSARPARAARAAIALACVLGAGGIPPAARAQTQAAAPLVSARHTDAHADRVILVPTAETHPQGTLFLSVYELIIPSIGYALSDRLQLSATGFTDLEGGFVEVNVKANLLRSRLLRVAVTSAIDYLRAEDDGEALFGRAGATLQICFELACRSSLSLHAMLVAHDELDTILPIGLGAAFTAHLSRSWSVLLEYSTLVNAAAEFEFIDLPVYLLAYGARLSPRPSWSLELSLIRELASDDEVRLGDRPIFDLIGIPFLVFTYRLGLPAPSSAGRSSTAERSASPRAP